MTELKVNKRARLFWNGSKQSFRGAFVLIVCAGMEYAAFVENVHHKRVLIDAELEAEKLFKQLLGKIVKEA